MTSNRLAGHALPNEGRVLNGYGYRVQTGPARCTCGAESPELYSDYARKKWHRQHKDDIRAEHTA